MPGRSTPTPAPSSAPFRGCSAREPRSTPSRACPPTFPVPSPAAPSLRGANTPRPGARARRRSCVPPPRSTRTRAVAWLDALYAGLAKAARKFGVGIVGGETARSPGAVFINVALSGEVERTLSMIDGIMLLVDASEGPLPQTKFVLGKALRLGLKPIVLINKVDRSDARAHQVHDEVFDLFAALEASDEQLDFPTLFASARQGWAATSLEAEHKDMTPLFDLILNHVPAPRIDSDPAFRMLSVQALQFPSALQFLACRITGTD